MSDASPSTDLDRDPTGEETLEEAFLAYREFGLRLPPVPRDLVDDLTEATPFVYQTRDVDLSDLGAFLAAAKQAGSPGYVAFGPVGSGLASSYFCYQAMTPSTALFVRLPHGGIDSSDERARTIVNGCLYRSEELLARSPDAPAAHRTIVVVDAIEAGLVRLGGEADARPSSDPLGEALAALPPV